MTECEVVRVLRRKAPAVSNGLLVARRFTRVKNGPASPFVVKAIALSANKEIVNKLFQVCVLGAQFLGFLLRREGKPLNENNARSSWNP